MMFALISAFHVFFHFSQSLVHVSFLCCGKADECLLLVGNFTANGQICDIFSNVGEFQQLVNCTSTNEVDICFNNKDIADVIGCSGDRIVSLNLSNYNLTGTLDFTQLFFPSALEFLDLSYNNLNNTFNWNSLSNCSQTIKQVDLSNNEFDEITNIGTFEMETISSIKISLVVIV